MDAIVNTILRARRRGLFRSRPVFGLFSAITEKNLFELEIRLKHKLPNNLRQWLLAAGYGDIDGNLSFRENWFLVIDRGPLRDCVIFAQDILGNFYAFNPQNEEIFFISRSQQGFASVAADFQSFFKELIHRNYQVEPWMDSLRLKEYNWKNHMD